MRLVAAPADAPVRRPLYHLLGNFEIVMQAPIQLGRETPPQKEEHPTGVEDQHHGERPGIPQGEPYAYTARTPHPFHGSPSRRTKPTPRTVWMSLMGKSWSTFFRRRAMWTSITLSSGVAREGSFHTSRVSISRDTSWFWWRSKYSRSSNSREVKSRTWLPRVT